MKIRNGSIELHVAEDGDPSAPPLLLLHGITSFGGTWEWLVPILAERFRVLRLDFRGHGASDRAPGEYSPDGYLRIMRVLILVLIEVKYAHQCFHT